MASKTLPVAPDLDMRNETPEEAAFRAAVAAQEEAIRHETDDFYWETEAARLPGITAERLKQLDAENPELVTLLMQSRSAVDMDAYEQDKEADREVNEAIKAEGTKWFQAHISSTERAAFTALWPPLDADGRQPPARKVPRPYITDRMLQGWTRNPKGKLIAGPMYPCNFLGTDRRPCTYPGGVTEQDRNEHEAARHPRQYVNRQALLDRESQSAQAESNRRLVEVLSRMQAGQDSSVKDDATVKILVAMAEKMGLMGDQSAAPKGK